MKPFEERKPPQPPSPPPPKKKKKKKRGEVKCYKSLMGKSKTTSSSTPPPPTPPPPKLRGRKNRRKKERKTEEKSKVPKSHNNVQSWQDCCVLSLNQPSRPQTCSQPQVTFKRQTSIDFREKAIFVTHTHWQYAHKVLTCQTNPYNKAWHPK